MTLSLASLFGRALRGFRAGDEHLAMRRLEDTGLPFTLTSPWFEDKAPMPDDAAGEGVGRNISPPLHWSGAPEKTQSFVLVVQDMDSPTPKPIVHLIAYDLLAGSDGLEAGALRRGGGLPLGKGTLGVGYHGPRPVKGHGVHHYVFQLFAVAAAPHFDRRPELGDVIDAIDGQVLGTAVLCGTYERE